MTTPRRAGTKPVIQTVSIADMMVNHESMLNARLPTNYGAIETASEALAAAQPPAREIVLRMHIVWDNPAANLDWSVLDHMHETGAVVVKVERVSRTDDNWRHEERPHGSR